MQSRCDRRGYRWGTAEALVGDWTDCFKTGRRRAEAAAGSGGLRLFAAYGGWRLDSVGGGHERQVKAEETRKAPLPLPGTSSLTRKRSACGFPVVFVMVMAVAPR
jgi:hypothetical protein